MNTIDTRYEFSPAPTPRQGAALLYCAHSIFDFTWRSMMHSHPHAELFYCMGGTGFLRIGEERLPLSEGDLFIITPHAIHTEHSSLDQPLEYIVLGLDHISFTAPLGEAPRYFLIHEERDALEARPYFIDILREAEKQREGYLDACKLILDVLLIKIGRLLTIGASQPASSQVSRECAQVKRLIDGHYMEPITLDLLAKKASLSKYYLNRTFRKHYGLPPMQYVNQRRVMEAMYLLLNTEHDSATITRMVGYSSPSYFSQAFRRAMGISPQQYRKAKQAMLRAR